MSVRSGDSRSMWGSGNEQRDKASKENGHEVDVRLCGFDGRLVSEKKLAPNSE